MNNQLGVITIKNTPIGMGSQGEICAFKIRIAIWNVVFWKTTPKAWLQEVVNKKRPIKNFKIAIRRNRCLHLRINTLPC